LAVRQTAWHHAFQHHQPTARSPIGVVCWNSGCQCARIGGYFVSTDWNL